MTKRSTFYVGKLGFALVEDTRLSETKRWVLVAPPGAKEMRLLLAKADNPEQKTRIGNQAGGRVFLFLHTEISSATTRPTGPRACASSKPPRHEPTAPSPCSSISTATNGI
jgi:hypothetical protein